MLKIAINSAPRITTPEATETQESQQQNVQEQIAPPQAKPVSEVIKKSFIINSMS